MIDFHDILDRMNQNQRINFDKVFQRMARRWQQDGVKPRILLHSCCGPCSTAVLDRLTGVADVTVYYFNPNIHPEAESAQSAWQWIAAPSPFLPPEQENIAPVGYAARYNGEPPDLPTSHQSAY